MIEKVLAAHYTQHHPLIFTDISVNSKIQNTGKTPVIYIYIYIIYIYIYIWKNSFLQIIQCIVAYVYRFFLLHCCCHWILIFFFFFLHHFFRWWSRFSEVSISVGGRFCHSTFWWNTERSSESVDLWTWWTYQELRN